jgi:predicted RND superfamily exporter protein
MKKRGVILERLAEFIIGRRKILMGLFTLITLVSILLIPGVRINYNLSSYLPDDMGTKKAMEIMEQEFSLSGMARVMVEDISVAEIADLKSRISQVEGVRSVVALNDVIDPQRPIEFYDEKVVEGFYKDGKALFQVEFTEDDYSLNTGMAIEAIQGIIGSKGVMTGSAVNAKAMREATLSEVLSVTAMALPLFVLVFLLTTQSWFEPVIYFIVLGISVLINMGTNVIFKDISFITNACAAILQFAISMDYSLFLLHRFVEERNKGEEPHKAMKTAIIHSFSSLSASCLTTVAGFMALTFMRYKVGLDIGLVLAKGIVLSLLSVLLLLPGITLATYRLIEKTRHSSFLPSLKRPSKAIVRSRWVFIILILMILVPAFLAQSANAFLYGENAITTSAETKSGIQQKRINEVFGAYNPVVLLIPNGNIPAEISLARELEGKGYMESVQGLVTLADPYIPRELLPGSVMKQFSSPRMSRMILALDTPEESPETMSAVEDIHMTVSRYYGTDYNLLGSSTSVKDIKTVVDKDFNLVNLISIILVGLIILFTFRSISLPIVLVLVIEASIWINMAIPYFMDASLSFMGYMIVSAIQLGATIDYAILLTNRYMHNRESMGKKESAIAALSDSGWSVITSALILFIAGMGVWIMSSIKGVSELGLLIGRGAALSGVMVLILLPQLLILLDRVIQKTTLKREYYKG